MKRKKVKDNMGFQLKIILWIGVYLIIMWIINWKIDQEFGYISKKFTVKQSINDYMKSINLTIIAALLLSSVWWVLAYNKTEIRRVFEQKTLLFAVVFLFIMFVIIFLGPAKKKIIDDLNHEYTFLYAYYILCGMSFNLFMFPPKSVERVMFFGGNAGRIIAALIILLIFLVMIILL